MTSELSISALTESFGAPEDVRSFAHTPGTGIVFGVGEIVRLSELCKKHGGSRILIVSDPGIAKAGHSARVKSLIEDSGLFAAVFDDVRENPTTEDVRLCVQAAQENEIDFIVGLGGGSSLDTAKGCNFILTNGGHMRDYWGVGKAEKPMLPFIAVPTTAGTGSECQSFALIADSETHMKMACGDKKAAAKAAILDPELTLTQPRSVTVHTGMDAITHAVETAVTKKRTETSFAYSKLAFSLLNEGFESVLQSPDELVGRAQMLLGAAYAGTAIENSMLGAAHSCANPLTAKFGIVHGEAVGVMMPQVVRFNAEDEEVASIYGELFEGHLAARLEELLVRAAMPLSLSDYSISADSLDELAEAASKQWTAQFNPREVDVASLRALYQSAMSVG
ncbi:MAG: iron-containing alcohol dehydrogenase [Verrucomicrobiota bacterium]